MKYSFETRAFCHLSKRFLSIFKGSRTYNLWWSEWNHLSNTPGSSKNSIFMNLMYFFQVLRLKDLTNGRGSLKGSQTSVIGMFTVRKPLSCFSCPFYVFFPSLLKVMFAMQNSAIYRYPTGRVSVSKFKRDRLHYLKEEKLASSMVEDKLAFTFLCQRAKVSFVQHGC